MRLYTTVHLSEAIQTVRDSFNAITQTETIPLNQALGRILAADVQSKEDIPAFHRSTVDGYGVRAKDTFGASESIPAFLPFMGQVEMGGTAIALPPNAAVYVPTGGMLPEGADSVVMIEQTARLDDLVNIYKQVAPGENVILKGEDVTAGSAVMTKGRRLKSADIGVLASLGKANVTVFQKPKIAVISTGNELVPWDTPSLPLGKIRDSNAPAVMALAEQYGAESFYGGIVIDDYEILKDKVTALLQDHHMVVLSGGSSVGMQDYTSRLLKELAGGDLLVEGIAIQPGKPTLLTNCGGKAVMGLPGHPVSALNIFSWLGREMIQRLAGACLESGRVNYQKPSIKGVLTQNIPSQPGRMDVVRVMCETIEKDGKQQVAVTPVIGKSGLLRTLRDSQGVVVVEEAQEGLMAGADVAVIPLD